MKSTWPKADKSTWTPFHHLIDILDVYPTIPGKEVPVHSKEDKIPYFSQWSQHVWVLFYSILPLLLQQALVSYTGKALGSFAVFFLYLFYSNFIVVRQVHMIRRLAHTYGFLDGDKSERDGIPDVGVSRIALSLTKVTTARLGFSVWLSYNPNISPIDVLSRVPWWGRLFLAVGIYTVVLDFWFYWYHRAMHEFDGLWKFHRTHHLTKHPNITLTAYADDEQEFFDIIGIPCMAYFTLRLLGFNLGFYEWWICHEYVFFTEVMGHSGLRLYLIPPSTFSWLLKLVDCELLLEDHDLHHRKGWRKSHNYGKQTRLWDRVFGTCIERIESTGENVDYENQAHMPLF